METANYSPNPTHEATLIEYTVAQLELEVSFNPSIEPKSPHPNSKFNFFYGRNIVKDEATSNVEEEVTFGFPNLDQQHLFRLRIFHHQCNTMFFLLDFRDYYCII